MIAANEMVIAAAASLPIHCSHRGRFTTDALASTMSSAAGVPIPTSINASIDVIVITRALRNRSGAGVSLARGRCAPVEGIPACLDTRWPTCR